MENTYANYLYISIHTFTKEIRVFTEKKGNIYEKYTLMETKRKNSLKFHTFLTSPAIWKIPFNNYINDVTTLGDDGVTPKGRTVVFKWLNITHSNNSTN